MKRYSLTLQSVLMMSALAACGQGTMIYDQQSATSFSFQHAVSFQPQQLAGQSFTPALTSIGFVQFYFFDPRPDASIGATVYVNLRADSISGPVLGSTDPVTMPAYTFGSGITNFFFATAVTLDPGTVYYLQPVVQSGDSTWPTVYGNYGYSGGTFYLNGSPNPNGYEAWFREGVLTPEPSSGLFVLAGIAGLYAARRLAILLR
jgi:hypothetical protein